MQVAQFEPQAEQASVNFTNPKFVPQSVQTVAEVQAKQFDEHAVQVFLSAEGKNPTLHA